MSTIDGCPPNICPVASVPRDTFLLEGLTFFGTSLPAEILNRTGVVRNHHSLHTQIMAWDHGGEAIDGEKQGAALNHHRESKDPPLDDIITHSLQARLLPADRISQPSGKLFDFWRTTPLSLFRKIIVERDEESRAVPSPAGVGQRFWREISWRSLARVCKRWLEHPMNVALLIWLVSVGCFLLFLLLLTTGLLNHAYPTKAVRHRWVEICNQVLNALFTLMSLYQHPGLCHQFALLCRWRSEDIVALRKIYCKNGTYRPNEWAHMVVVVVLLHVACLSQYALCALYWAYAREARPKFSADLCQVLGIIAPVLAGLYTVYSPLGREYDLDSDEESQHDCASEGNPKKDSRTGLKLYDRRALVSRPEWRGGLFDCWEEPTVAFLSFFCTFCVFGWNMKRLGFGNMYVHVATFALLCLAPFWVFSISAMNIGNDAVRRAVGITGVVLCFLGLLYGGFWRIQIRRRFGLPGSRSCFGSKSMTDYTKWLFCWPCALAQEVRTGNFYGVEDDSFYRKRVDCEDGGGPTGDCGRVPCSESPEPSQDGGQSDLSGAGVVDDDAMVPPVQPLIDLDDEGVDGNVVGSLTSPQLVLDEESQEHPAQEQSIGSS